MEKTRFGVLILLCIGVFGALLSDQGYLTATTTAITVGWMLYLLYYKFLWKFDPTQNIPRIEGKYNFDLNYLDDNNNEKQKTLDVRISQNSLNNIEVYGSSSSTIFFSESCNLVENKRRWFVIFTYISESTKDSRPDNPIHYGTTKILVDGQSLTTGEYWTSRETSGHIECTKQK